MNYFQIGFLLGLAVPIVLVLITIGAAALLRSRKESDPTQPRLPGF